MDAASTPAAGNQLVLIWDLPVRVFHWAFAAAVASAMGIALLGGDDSPLFPWHALLGLTAAVMVALRVVWGWVGTRHARFVNWWFGPMAIAGYFAGVVSGRGSRHVGHNPGSALAIYLMLGLAIGLSATGLVLGTGGESAKDLHEALAWALLGVVLAHVLGVVVHTVRFRENITAAMIHGRKRAAPELAIESPRRGAAVLLVVVVAGCLGGLSTLRDPSGRTLRLPGLQAPLELGEADEHGSREGAGERHDDDD